MTLAPWRPLCAPAAVSRGRRPRPRRALRAQPVSLPPRLHWRGLLSLLSFGWVGAVMRRGNRPPAVQISEVPVPKVGHEC